jgi:hypothetical protein
VLKKLFERQWAVQEAMMKANDFHLWSFISPHCSDDQQDSVLTSLVERGRWESVGKVLKRPGVREARRQWALEEASKRAEDLDFQYYILPHCSDDQLDSVLTSLVERKL